jgi:hypothetical protein
MAGEFGEYTVHGGWLIFLALVALWIALAIEARSRRLSSLLEAAIEEAEKLKADADEPGVADGQPPGAELGHLAEAVEGEGKGVPVGQAGTRETPPAGEA